MEELLPADLWIVVVRYLPPLQAYEMIMQDLSCLRKFLLVPETTYRAHAGVIILRSPRLFPSPSTFPAARVGAGIGFGRVNHLEAVYLPPNIILFPTQLESIVFWEIDSSILVRRNFTSIVAGGRLLLDNLTTAESASVYDQLIDLGCYYPKNCDWTILKNHVLRDAIGM